MQLEQLIARGGQYHDRTEPRKADLRAHLESDTVMSEFSKSRALVERPVWWTEEFELYVKREFVFSSIPVRFPPRALAYNMYNFPGFEKEWDKASFLLGQTGSAGFIRAVTEEYDLFVESGDDRVSDVTLCGR